MSKETIPISRDELDMFVIESLGGCPEDIGHIVGEREVPVALCSCLGETCLMETRMANGDFAFDMPSRYHDVIKMATTWDYEGALDD